MDIIYTNASGSSLVLLNLSARHFSEKSSKNEERNGSRGAMRAAVLFGLLTLVFLVGFFVGNELDPVYGLLASAYTPPSVFSSLLGLIVPHAMVFVTLGVLSFSMVSWFKGYWKLAGRIHYTLFASFLAVLSWIFHFCNVILKQY